MNLETHNEDSDSSTYGKSGVPISPIHGILDGTKITCFMGCPREYFFRNILGWQPEGANAHLVFGSAIHRGMEILYPIGTSGDFSKDNVRRAQEAMLSIFAEAYERDEMFSVDNAKNPDQANALIEDYVANYQLDLKRYETMFVEVQGVVPISDTRLLHFNMDRLYKDLRTEKISCQEHKTTGQRRQQWEEKWDYVFQPGTYFYALFAHFGLENIGEVSINGLIVRAPSKTTSRNFEFVRIPVKKDKSQISAWVSHANHWCDQLDWNIERLCETSPGDPVLAAFPPNTEYCSQRFGGCRYYPHCHQANPLARGLKPPPGYETALWDPTKREVTRYRLDLTKKNATFEEVKHES